MYIDSWFCSVKTWEQLASKYSCHVIGAVKTAHAGFPAEALRWTLKDMQRGEHVVFKCEGKDLWAIGWSDVHFKLYLASCGTSDPGEAATKKRQRSDGRNFRIDISRPSVVEEYAKSMGRVDQHNRFRQGMMRLHQVWKTTTWQTRMINELLATTCVDAFMLCKHLMPKWKGCFTGAHDSGTFFSWLSDLVGLMLVRVKENDNVLMPENHEPIHQTCRQIKIGTKKTESGVQKGKMRSIQERCRYCTLAGRYEAMTPSRQKKGAHRTIYCCAKHPNVYMCKEGKFTCWAEHLAACAQECNER